MSRVQVAVLVPVKGFHVAKVRLAPALGPQRRAALARKMANRVLKAADPLPVAVVCDDEEVATWAAGKGAEVVWRPGRGLNGAVEDGVAHLGATGATHVIVAHADLPLADSLSRVIGDPDVITVVPDRRDDGTNVLFLPSRVGFHFSYGPGSFVRHLGEGGRLGLQTRILRDERLGWDVDVPDDLAYATR